jgi:hypothetical protein
MYSLLSGQGGVEFLGYNEVYQIAIPEKVVKIDALRVSWKRSGAA